ncbi:unnamed protein product [Phytomonas sp. Hart1]|nr:unnamed protein product [Phytomonas sp. Hart1]|eukprot:CCW65969.1 unnamed protein product [Phytomonas sp. isolate Hart1]
MLRHVKMPVGIPLRHMFVQKRTAMLQSEKPCAILADKIVRGTMQNTFYNHPSYVMAREKMYYTIWVDIGIFSISFYALISYFTLAYFFKA